MTEAEAQARLERMVAHDSTPTLDATEVADLLAMSRLVDADGLAPTATGWTPTYDLNRGAAEGWRWKAGQVAADFDFKTDGQEFNRSQVLRHCEQMVRHYSRRIVASIPVAGTLARSDD